MIIACSNKLDQYCFFSVMIDVSHGEKLSVKMLPLIEKKLLKSEFITRVQVWLSVHILLGME